MNIDGLCKELGLDTMECSRAKHRYGADRLSQELEVALNEAINMAYSHGSKYKINASHIVQSSKQDLNGCGDCDAMIYVGMLVDGNMEIYYKHPIPNGKGYKSSSI